jgi:hypothetical protein
MNIGQAGWRLRVPVLLEYGRGADLSGSAVERLVAAEITPGWESSYLLRWFTDELRTRSGDGFGG